MLHNSTSNWCERLSTLGGLA